MSLVEMIWAESVNGVIGVDNGLPWHIPEDLEWFKKHTLNKSVIMGRKTFESLPDKVRPLPGRENIVVSRNPDYKGEGFLVASSLQEAISKASKQPIIIGGGELYKQGLKFAGTVYVTHVDAFVEGDTYAPSLDTLDWVSVYGSDEGSVSSSGLGFQFKIYHRV